MPPGLCSLIVGQCSSAEKIWCCQQKKGEWMLGSQSRCPLQSSRKCFIQNTLFKKAVRCIIQLGKIYNQNVSVLKSIGLQLLQKLPGVCDIRMRSYHYTSNFQSSLIKYSLSTHIQVKHGARLSGKWSVSSIKQELHLIF